MTERVEWSGWVLEGRKLLAPRKIVLSPQESRVLRVLIEAKGRPVSLEDLADRANVSSKDSTVRSIVNAIRPAVGRGAIASKRFVGYWVVSARAGRGPGRDPIDDLVKNLKDALAAAKALRRTMS